MLDVMIHSDRSAIVESIDTENNVIQYYFSIAYSGYGSMEQGLGSYVFNSLADLKDAPDDTRGYRIEGAPFHGKTTIRRSLTASSLDEACEMFFSEWNESYRLTGRL